LQDIVDNAGLIQSYVQGMQREAFESDRRTRDAVECCLERISEAATKLGPQAEELAPGPPWQAIRAFGNALRHTYDQIDPDRIWEIVTRDLTDLVIAAEAALARLDPD
jgi:uncharacterized protein with HEPN domain